MHHFRYFVVMWLGTFIYDSYSSYNIANIHQLSFFIFHRLLKMSLNKVLEEIKEKRISTIRFEQTDLHGIARCKLIPARHFKDKVTRGLNFYMGHLGLDVQGTIVQGTGYNEEVGYGDAVMFPDFDTFKVLPWIKNTARILIEPTRAGQEVAGHPRVVARKQLEKLRGLGYSLLASHEYEFHVIDKETGNPPIYDTNPRATVQLNTFQKYLDHLMEDLPKVGLDIECAETEHGASQLELTYKPTFGIQAADNAHTFKTSAKEIALLNGFVASFMTKPYSYGGAASSHICHSLWDAEGKVPLLYDAKSPTGLSKLGQHWIAGLLAHAPAITILLAPTVNCIKNVKPWKFYPVNATWGRDNRSAMIRAKINGPNGTYFENRAALAGSNQYISLAATVAAGMDGIINKLELPPEVTGNAYDPDDVPADTLNLPTNTEDALEALANDHVIREAMGGDFIKCFTAVRRYEAKLAQEAQSNGHKNWEFDYFFHYMWKLVNPFRFFYNVNTSAAN